MSSTSVPDAKPIRRRSVVGAGLGTLACRSSRAEETRLVFGQSAPMRKETIAATNELALGIRLAFERANRAGGVAGKQFALQLLDDGWEPERTVRNTMQFIETPGVVGLVGYRGTPNIEAVYPLLPQGHIALFGPQSGVSSIYQPRNELVFPVRASYRSECDRLLEHAATIGRRRIALFYTESSFGEDVRRSVMQLATTKGIELVAQASYGRLSLDVGGAVALIDKARPDAVLLISASAQAAKFIEATRVNSRSFAFYLMSNVSDSEFARRAANVENPPVISQVYPHTRATTPLVQWLRDDISRSGSPAPSYAVLEGYLIGSLATRAAQLAGPAPTRSRIATALRGRDVQIGGVNLSYAESGYAGNRFVELTMPTRDGRFIR